MSITGVELIRTSGLRNGQLQYVSRGRNRGARLVEKTDLPQRSVAGAIGVECEDAVVFGGDIENVVRAVARNFYVGHEKRLSVDRATHFECAEPTELLSIYVLRREDLFVERGTDARVVVLRVARCKE